MYISEFCIKSGSAPIKALLEPIETVSTEGTFCDTVQVPSGGDNMLLN